MSFLAFSNDLTRIDFFAVFAFETNVLMFLEHLEATVYGFIVSNAVAIRALEYFRDLFLAVLTPAFYTLHSFQFG